MSLRHLRHPAATLRPGSPVTGYAAAGALHADLAAGAVERLHGARADLGSQSAQAPQQCPDEWCSDCIEGDSKGFICVEHNQDDPALVCRAACDGDARSTADGCPREWCANCAPVGDGRATCRIVSCS